MAAKILRYFEYDHLPAKLQDVSRRFAEVATWIDNSLPECDEKRVALRKLLEARDAAVRAKLEGV
jgi:hypothetical protein